MNKIFWGTSLSIGLAALLMFPTVTLAGKISTEGATFDASTRYATPETEPAKAFDGILSEYWRSNRAANDEWLEVTLPSPQMVKSFRVQHGEVGTLNGRLEASNDEESWTVLTTFSHPAIDQWYVEDFANSTAYTYYRLYFTTGDPSDSWVRIYEWELYSNVGANVPEFSTISLIIVMIGSAYFVVTQSRNGQLSY